jgi:hypothetical protein
MRRRVDEPTSVRKFRVAPRASYAPLDRLPGRFRFRAGRGGWPKTQFGSTMGYGLWATNYGLWARFSFSFCVLYDRNRNHHINAHIN